MSADVLTDSAAWLAVCPALRCALAAPTPSSVTALALLRRLVRSAQASCSATQLAQLAAVLAAHLSQSPTADAAEALLEAEAALRTCWQARALRLRVLCRGLRAGFHRRACKRVRYQSWRQPALRCCACPALCLQSPPPSASLPRGPPHGWRWHQHALPLLLRCSRMRLRSARLLLRHSRPLIHAAMIWGEQLRSECLGRCFTPLQCVLSFRSAFAPRRLLSCSRTAMPMMPMRCP